MLSVKENIYYKNQCFDYFLTSIIQDKKNINVKKLTQNMPDTLTYYYIHGIKRNLGFLKLVKVWRPKAT